MYCHQAIFFITKTTKGLVLFVKKAFSKKNPNPWVNSRVKYLVWCGLAAWAAAALSSFYQPSIYPSICHLSNYLSAHWLSTYLGLVDIVYHHNQTFLIKPLSAQIYRVASGTLCSVLKKGDGRKFKSIFEHPENFLWFLTHFLKK